METGVRVWGDEMLDGVLTGYVLEAGRVGTWVSVTGQIVV